MVIGKEESHMKELNGFMEVMNALHDGMKIRCNDWRPECYICMTSDGSLIDDQNKKFHIEDLTYFVSEKWEIYSLNKDLAEFISRCDRTLYLMSFKHVKFAVHGACFIDFMNEDQTLIRLTIPESCAEYLKQYPGKGFISVKELGWFKYFE